MSELVDVWEPDHDQGPDELTSAELERTREPSFRCVVLSGTGDTLGLQIVGDRLPSGDANIVYVGGRGTFELVRVERWPPTPGTKRPRVLLKLRAWPTR